MNRRQFLVSAGGTALAGMALESSLFATARRQTPAMKKELFAIETQGKEWSEKPENRNKPEAKILAKIATVPQCLWIESKDLTALAKAVAGAKAKKQILGVVLYYIPNRDIGQHSAGGAEGVEKEKVYQKWLTDVTATIGQSDVVVIIEPDAIPHLDELGKEDQEIRIKLLQAAVKAMKKNPNARVYLDAGHSNWHPPEWTAKRLLEAGVKDCRGFAVNVSNYRTTKEAGDFGKAVSILVGNMPFVIDVSRNGNGPLLKVPPGENDWCNPPGRALGVLPTFVTGIDHCDALIWGKHPDESDGECRGGPRAGVLWVKRAVELYRMAEELAREKAKTPKRK
ncbi:glycoside hydrolase family 6 protein [Candidatus Parcubacteria bacterium]|nr:glycoside hydrolase family 6 protein [Candidatus Parcubacteria bacterium]